MFKVFDRTRFMIKTFQKQVNKIKFTQIVTRAQLADTASTQSKQINVYIFCIITLIKFHGVRGLSATLSSCNNLCEFNFIYLFLECLS